MDAANARMKEVVAALGFTSNESFEDAVGLGHGFVSRLTRNVKKSSLDKISRKFPTVNVGWIKTGYGEMFTEDKTILAPTGTFTERLEKFRMSTGLSKREFELKVNLPKGFLNIKRESCWGNTLLKINKTYPQLSIEWLLYGLGKMLVADGDLQDLSQFVSYKDRIRTFLEYLGVSEYFFLNKCQISKSMVSLFPDVPSESDMKAISKAYPNLNMSWLKYGKGEMIKDEVAPKSSADIMFIPLVPQMAYAGYLNGYADEEYIKSLPTVPFVKEGNESYTAFEVSGDSMDDGSSRAYQNGDIVICKEISPVDVRNYGLPTSQKDFVIVHSGGILIKQVKEFNKETGEIVLHSFNPIYSDVTIHLGNIMKIFTVEFQQKKRK